MRVCVCELYGGGDVLYLCVQSGAICDAMRYYQAGRRREGGIIRLAR